MICSVSGVEIINFLSFSLICEHIKFCCKANLLLSASFVDGMAETSHARTVLDAQRFVNGDRVSPTCQKSLRMMDHDSPKTRIDRSLELGIISSLD